MASPQILIAIALTAFSFRAWTEDKPPETIYLFGKKPIQIEVNKEGLKQNKEPGYNCELKAKLSGEKFSDWGQTEKDARSLVAKKCADKAGLLLCKEKEAVCKKEE